MRWPLGVIVLVAALFWWTALTGRAASWPEAVAFGLAFVSMAIAAGSMRLQGFAPVTWRGRRGDGVVALTFDDGPHPESTRQVLKVLERHEAVATFFVIGERVEAHPEVVREMHGLGHQVESHGWDHSWRQWLTARRAAAAIEKARDAIERTTGRAPVALRPPYGVVLPGLAAAVCTDGPWLAGWSLRAFDGGGGGDAETMATRLLDRVCDGDIVLLHDASHRVDGPIPLGGAVLDRVLKGLRRKGLRPVRLDELI